MADTEEKLDRIQVELHDVDKRVIRLEGGHKTILHRLDQHDEVCRETRDGVRGLQQYNQLLSKATDKRFRLLMVILSAIGALVALATFVDGL